jgi:hypothetical protein
MSFVTTARNDVPRRLGPIRRWNSKPDQIPWGTSGFLVSSNEVQRDRSIMREWDRYECIY